MISVNVMRKSTKEIFNLFFSASILNNPTYRKRSLAAVLLILVDIIVTSLVPYSTKLLIDKMNMNHFNGVELILLMLGVFWTLDKIINHIQEIVFFPVINRSIRDITSKVTQHIHQIPLSYYEKLSASETISSIRRVSLSARSFFKIIFLLINPSIIKLIIATIIAIRIGSFSWILLPMMMCIFYVLYHGTKRYALAREQAWDASDKVVLSIHDSILNTKVVRPFKADAMKKIDGRLSTEAEQWNKTNTELHTIYIKIGLLIGFTLCIVLAYAITDIKNKSLTVGDIVLLKGQFAAAF